MDRIEAAKEDYIVVEWILTSLQAARMRAVVFIVLEEKLACPFARCCAKDFDVRKGHRKIVC